MAAIDGRRLIRNLQSAKMLVDVTGIEPVPPSLQSSGTKHSQLWLVSPTRNISKISALFNVPKVYRTSQLQKPPMVGERLKPTVLKNKIADSLFRTKFN